MLLLYLLSQVCEVLKLLNALLPTSARDQDVQMVLDKESFLANQPDLLQKFGNDILPIFDAGVFFAVDALLTPEKCSQLKFPVLSGTHFSIDSNQRHAAKEVFRCLCYAFDNDQFSSASEMENCKLEKDSVHNLAKHIRTKYLTTELLNSEKGLTDILQKLRTFSAALTDLVDMSLHDDTSAQHEEKYYCMLHQIITILNGKEPISTFEFIESGIVKSLVNYLSNGLYMREKVGSQGVSSHYDNVEKRFEKLQHALSSVENFPVILSHASKQRNSFATVPNGRCVSHPCLKVRFTKEEVETSLYDYSEDVLTVDPFSSLDAIEGFLWRKVSIKRTEPTNSVFQASHDMKGPIFQGPLDAGSQGKSPDLMESESMSSEFPEVQEDKDSSQSTPESASNLREMTPGEATSSGETQQAAGQMGGYFVFDRGKAINFYCSCGISMIVSAEQEQHVSSEAGVKMKTQCPESCSGEDASQQIEAEHEIIPSGKLWGQVHTLTYRAAVEPKQTHPQECLQNSPVSAKVGTHLQQAPFFSNIFVPELVAELDKSGPTYDILFLLKSLEGMNKFKFHLMSRERTKAFAEGRIDNLDNLKVAVPVIPENEFVNSKLTEKLEQQMRDPLAVSIGGMPLWCNQLMALYPFLFGFEARCKYFRLAAFGPLQAQPHSSFHNTSGAPSDRRHMLVVLEVEYNEEVGTGLGPTLEFYTLVCHEFQKTGLGMWREDYTSSTSCKAYRQGQEWPGRGKALQDGRVLDLPFSKAFYKLAILGQELSVYDIQSFDPELGRVLLEFQALIDRKRYLETVCGEKSTFDVDMCFRNTKLRIFTLILHFRGIPNMFLLLVTMTNLEEYVSLLVDTTINAGISRQVEAFRSGFNQFYQLEYSKYKITRCNEDVLVSNFCPVEIDVDFHGFPIKHLQIFTEEELEKLLCGERDSWACNGLLDHIKFDHGYTASSPPIINVITGNVQEFDHEQRRAFLQFVTGAPRLPPGGLASLNPKLTIVRKHCSKWADADLPSVMTCANYLKLPPYSSKVQFFPQ
ncbi:E3 ubiquitin-protein ligase UPL4 [Vitis vinifera]|uniref:E3 ubiquitin-protein ligase UPL4 n=1 Tax=Vitis vinifera TaxID=29760 RepID=A0A438DW18_VITVI|nr:E3 ubiquitin-protein ligase UPL4 [Vitis vinifera]